MGKGRKEVILRAFPVAGVPDFRTPNVSSPPISVYEYHSRFSRARARFDSVLQFLDVFVCHFHLPAAYLL